MFLIKTEQNSNGQDYRKVYIYADVNFINSEKTIVFDLNKFEQIFDGVEWTVLSSAYKKHFYRVVVSNATQVYMDGKLPKVELEVDMVEESLPTDTLDASKVGLTCLVTSENKVYEVIDEYTTDDNGNEVVEYKWQEFVFESPTDQTTVTHNNVFYRYNPETGTFTESPLIGLRDFFMSYTFAQIGGTSVDDHIYQVLANYIDQYLYENHQNEILMALGMLE